MLSPARKLVPRREAVVLRLLACLAFFGCVGAQLVAHANSGTLAAAAADRDQTQKFAASNTAGVERLHDAAVGDALSATEAEQPETDVALEVLPFRLSTRFAPIVRFAGPTERVVYANGWRPQAISSVVMAQGPP